MNSEWEVTFTFVPMCETIITFVTKPYYTCDFFTFVTTPYYICGFITFVTKPYYICDFITFVTSYYTCAFNTRRSMHDSVHDHAVTFKRRHRKNRPKKQITSTSLQETDRPTDRPKSECHRLTFITCCVRQIRRTHTIRVAS